MVCKWKCSKFSCAGFKPSGALVHLWKFLPCRVQSTFAIRGGGTYSIWVTPQNLARERIFPFFRVLNFCFRALQQWKSCAATNCLVCEKVNWDDGTFIDWLQFLKLLYIDQLSECYNHLTSNHSVFFIPAPALTPISSSSFGKNSSDVTSTNSVLQMSFWGLRLRFLLASKIQGVGPFLHLW
jgi:hypothetical protein